MALLVVPLGPVGVLTAALAVSLPSGPTVLLSGDVFLVGRTSELSVTARVSAEVSGVVPPPLTAVVAALLVVLTALLAVLTAMVASLAALAVLLDVLAALLAALAALLGALAVPAAALSSLASSLLRSPVAALLTPVPFAQFARFVVVPAPLVPRLVVVLSSLIALALLVAAPSLSLMTAVSTFLKAGASLLRMGLTAALLCPAPPTAALTALIAGVLTLSAVSPRHSAVLTVSLATLLNSLLVSAPSALAPPAAVLVLLFAASCVLVLMVSHTGFLVNAVRTSYSRETAKRVPQVLPSRRQRTRATVSRLARSYGE